MQDDFSSVDQIKIQVCTWNMGGVKPFESVDLGEWLFPQGTEDENHPDVYIVGFQEVIPLKSSRLMSFKTNKADVDLFKNLVLKNLNKHASSDQYQVCREVDMFGLF